jgi:DNA modification methylase
MKSRLIHGDCLEILKTIESGSIDCMVTDPPYGLGFMGKDWDRAVPSMNVWKETLRILKPGSFGFVMSAPRIDLLGEMGRRLQNAGFETGFTPIFWVHADRCFPKARKIGDGSYVGFQPKPVVEVVIVVMKPGRGVTWLEEGRIPIVKGQDDRQIRTMNVSQRSIDDGWGMQRNKGGIANVLNTKGRFPSNLLVSDKSLDSVRRKHDSGSFSRYFDLDSWADTLPVLVVPRASKGEKGKNNNHPTVKPLKLMEYLITIGSRPGNIILDPYLGSGTTVLAAQKLNRSYIGIEISEEYYRLACLRCQYPPGVQP